MAEGLLGMKAIVKPYAAVFFSLLLCCEGLPDTILRHEWSLPWTGHGGNAIPTTDDAGNIILFGAFSLIWDSDPSPGEDWRRPAGPGPYFFETDLYVTKLGPDGSYKWTYTAGGLNSDVCSAVVTDAHGNLYIAGAFKDVVDFDPGDEVDEHRSPPGTFPSGPLYAPFITRLGPGGEYLGTISFQGPGEAWVTDLAMTPEGDLILAGTFAPPFDFDPGPGVADFTTTPIGANVYLLRLDTRGHYLWHRTIGGAGHDIATHVAVAHDGGIYLAGTFRGTVDFDPGPGTDFRTATPFPVIEDVFLTRFAADGAYQWTATWSVLPLDGLVVASDGSVILAGHFEEAIDFDPTPGVDLRTPTPGTCTYTCADMFVTRLHSDGSYGWTWTAGGPRPDEPRAMVLIRDSGILISGEFRDTAVFDPGPPVIQRTSPAPSNSGFLLRLSMEGKLEWLRAPLSSAQNFDHLTVDPFGEVLFYRTLRADSDLDPTCTHTFFPPEFQFTNSALTRLTWVAPADADEDGEVDLFDVAAFQNCFEGENATACNPGCDVFDIQQDNALDLADAALLLNTLTGP